MKLRNRIFTVAACALGLTTFSAAACSCMPSPPPQEALAKADAVFSGTVENIEKTSEKVLYDGKESSYERLKVTVRVQESWKGTNAATLVVYTSPNGASCGYRFTKGTRYLIYAGHGEKKELVASLCSRTASMSQAQGDLQALGAGKKP